MSIEKKHSSAESYVELYYEMIETQWAEIKKNWTKKIHIVDNDNSNIKIKKLNQLNILNGLGHININ
jgi:hypothetical protein